MPDSGNLLLPPSHQTCSEGWGKAHDHWVDFKADWRVHASHTLCTLRLLHPPPSDSVHLPPPSHSPIFSPCSTCRLDDGWHHLSVSWSWASGAVTLYLDGQPKTAFWVSQAGEVQARGSVAVELRCAAGCMLSNEPCTHASPHCPQPSLVLHRRSRTPPAAASTPASRPAATGAPTAPWCWAKSKSATVRGLAVWVDGRRCLHSCQNPWGLPQTPTCCCCPHPPMPLSSPQAAASRLSMQCTARWRSCASGTACSAGELQRLFRLACRLHLIVCEACALLTSQRSPSRLLSLAREDVVAGMRAADPPSAAGLVHSYSFIPNNVAKAEGPRQQARRAWCPLPSLLHRLPLAGLLISSSPTPLPLPSSHSKPQALVRDVHGGGRNPLLLGADAPSFEYSTAPLAGPEGRPVAPPAAGSAGHALFVSDQQVGWAGGWIGGLPAADGAQCCCRRAPIPGRPLPFPSPQVLILKNFSAMPSEQLTLEFWMQTTGDFEGSGKRTLALLQASHLLPPTPPLPPSHPPACACTQTHRRLPAGRALQLRRTGSDVRPSQQPRQRVHTVQSS